MHMRRAVHVAPHQSFGLSPDLIYSYRSAVTGGEAICHTIGPQAETEGVIRVWGKAHTVWVMVFSTLKMSYFIMVNSNMPLISSTCSALTGLEYTGHFFSRLFWNMINFFRLPSVLSALYGHDANGHVLTLLQASYMSFFFSRAVCIYSHIYTSPCSLIFLCWG